MKLRNKILTILLSGLMLFSVFSVGCNNNNGGTEEPETPTVNATSDFTYHYVTGTFHEIKSDFDNPVGDFVKSGQTKYAIAYIDDSREAAQFLSTMMGKCAGKALAMYRRVESEEQVRADLESANPENYYILIGFEDLFPDEVTPLATLGVAGCQVKTVGKNVFINAYTSQGYQTGVNDFLREVTGYDYIGYDTIDFTNMGEVLPQLDIVDRPDFDYRCPDDASSPKEQIRGQDMSATGNFFYSAGTRCPWVHNVKYFTGAPSDQYWINTSVYPDGIDPDGAVEYSSFLDGSDGFLFGKFIEEDTRIDRKWLSSDTTMWQGCFTAHGDRESYKRLVKRFANMLIYAMVTTGSNNIMYSANDVTTGTASANRCSCQACEASYEYYGFTMGGAQVSLMNDATLLLNEYKETKTEIDENGNVYYPYKDREFNVVILAYGASLPAPTLRNEGEYVYDENGEGVPMTQKWFDYDTATGKVIAYDWEEVFDPDEYDPQNPMKLKFVENAQVMYASSGANWTHTFLEPENISRYTATKAWAGLGGHYYIWAYEKCYYMYLYPYPAHDSMFENYRYFYNDLKTKWIYNEGTGENPKCSGFSMLLEYMNGKSLYNVNYNFKDVLDKFFEKWFDVAAPYMRDMFDSIQLQLRWAEKEGYYVGTVHNETMGKAEVFSYGTIQTYLELIDKAYAAIEVYRYTNPELYASLREHILIESLFPRFSMCETYDVYLTDAELLQYRLDFKRDFDSLNTRATSTPREHYTMSQWYTAWGIA